MSSPSSPVTPSSAIPGDRERWLVEHAMPHEVSLRGYLHNRFPSVCPDDVVQESYLKLLRSKAAHGIASTKAYFFSIARNTALTFLRRERIYAGTPVGELPDWRVVDETGVPKGLADPTHHYQLAVEALDRLPRRCRDVVELAVLRGLSNAEIAQRLGMSEPTVRVQLARGVKKCREFVAEMGEGA